MAPKRNDVARDGCRQGAFLACLAVLVGLIMVAGERSAAALQLRLPEAVTTHPDGRTSIQELFETYLELTERGWQMDVVAVSQPAGTPAPMPIIALRSPQAGPAVWVLAGIHGEEPAGPMAVAAAIDDLAKLGERTPVVLMPLCNPYGYARNWRYLDMPTYSAAQDGQSVGDSSHLLPDPTGTGSPRAARASSPEAADLTSYVLETARTYPPRVTIDLHEDDSIPAGYVYSQGELGAADPLALAAVAVLRERDVAIQLDGETRFGEAIVEGVIGPVEDSSIDELLSARQVLVRGAASPGPAAQTVLVFETPSGELALKRRVAAHAALLRALAARITPQKGP